MDVELTKNLPPEAMPPVPPLEQVEKLVSASARIHGHLCPGQVIGVRMSILGLGLLGYPSPLPYPEIKNLVGVVESERCLADAVAVASGLRFGRGSLKLINLGLLAVSFGEISSGRAVRLISREKARKLALDYVPQANNPHAAQTEAYKIMPNDELFDASWVELKIPAHEMPGARPPKMACEQCGVMVRSGQAVHQDGRTLCPVCAGRAYFNPGAKLEL
ncbi:FmdE family protein [Desulfoferula mesophila]|uniref:Formylmethanofuran dehydrogenase subunit E n=1 Tax=Desulfoferula mesophila TaxID=3058419 RepID=A0AAU9EFA5_9BACT|nr:formylmethanofuran dehydrogenase subunit E [Desulfoferula mesophilus]